MHFERGSPPSPRSPHRGSGLETDERRHDADEFVSSLNLVQTISRTVREVKLVNRSPQPPNGSTCEPVLEFDVLITKYTMNEVEVVEKTKPYERATRELLEQYDEAR